MKCEFKKSKTIYPCCVVVWIKCLISENKLLQKYNLLKKDIKEHKKKIFLFKIGRKKSSQKIIKLYLPNRYPHKE